MKLKKSVRYKTHLSSKCIMAKYFISPKSALCWPHNLPMTCKSLIAIMQLNYICHSITGAVISTPEQNSNF